MRQGDAGCGRAWSRRFPDLRELLGRSAAQRPAQLAGVLGEIGDRLAADEAGCAVKDDVVRAAGGGSGGIHEGSS
jgi:hypothetical protein